MHALLFARLTSRRLRPLGARRHRLRGKGVHGSGLLRSSVADVHHTATGAWSDGSYELTIRADGRPESTCKFRFPEQLPNPPGRGVRVACGNGTFLNIGNESKCESGCDGEKCWQGCTPIPDKFESHLGVPGNPTEITLTLVRDGQTLLDEKLRPDYRTVYPNGPECSGMCRNAQIAYSVP